MLLKVEYLNRWSHALLSIDLLCGRPGVVSTCSTNITNYLNDLLMVKSEPLSCFTDTVENLIKLSRHLLKTSSTSFAGSQKKWLSSEHKQNQITCTMLPNCRHQSSGNLKGQTKHLRKNSIYQRYPMIKYIWWTTGTMKQNRFGEGFPQRRARGIPQFCMCASPRNVNMPTAPTRHIPDVP